MSSQVQTKNISTIGYVVHDANEPFKLENLILDDLQPTEVLVEMQYSGICHTDLVIQQGQIRVCPYPAILGHEGAGKILALGSAVNPKRNLKVGDTVLLSINYCEECKFCKAEHPADCIEGTRLHLFGVRPDGTTAAKLEGKDVAVRSHFFGQSSFLQKSFVQESCVVKVPDGVAEERIPFLAAMGCGYQTGAGTVLNILKPEPDSCLVVFGLGTVGLTAIMAAKYLKVRQIIGVDIFDHKLPLATELGCTDVLNSKSLSGEELVKKIKELTGKNNGADFAIDCTGVPKVIEAMLNVLSMRGTAATVGVPPSGAKIEIDPLQYLLGSRGYRGCREGDSNPPVFIPQLCKMQADGHFPVEKLCKVYDYKDFEKALHDLHDGKVTKPVIKWS
ncbi:uncharacterized protein MYCFIDRAFT_30433 [Pseudocercospora fijiensis CIRAD86]|uniref:Enoyl reductase (ER) domain-containing protein n=1 Tax=Pseudocercospora fijiensis (strain CIRAD86) TaxID=383855 RepID=M2ZAS0_PSEFD|nr:uncharacterized protein MYCFIDRAFT_30433 [Pseudocercospora fijiensis CIRAD86]EME86925.1 hypothetical protein MYCFIDRAFT_30433 [Pseudocercospora fijiensis CIRAD86]